MKFLIACLAGISAGAGGDSPTIVSVEGRPVTQADVEALMRSRQIPPSLRPALRKAFAQRLVDIRLMESFLKSRKVEPKPAQIDAAVQRWKRGMRAKGHDPQAILKKRGLDEAGLRRELWLPIAWSNYARQIIPDREIRERFAKHRREFDGTRLRASQIVLKLSKDASAENRKAVLKKLRQIREEIVSGKTTFSEAAKAHSQSPSGKRGGDVGYFAYRETMPEAITSIAFSLKKGDVSRPFATPFGAHLLKVTDVKPGQLSLEDVRPEVFAAIAKERWNETVAKQRKAARIEWSAKP